MNEEVPKAKCVAGYRLFTTKTCLYILVASGRPIEAHFAYELFVQDLLPG